MLPLGIITGVGLYTPPETISNEELVTAFNAYVNNYNQQHAGEIAAGDVEALQESSVEFIEKASGIMRRHVVDKSGILDPDRMCPIIPDRPDSERSLQCDMSVAAARQALENAGRTAADIDLVIVACSNLQRAYPAIAVEVQAALGIDGYAFDMNVACSSATFGMNAACDALQTGSAKGVLVVSPEICSGHLEFRDRDCHFIFGDACTAVVIEKSASQAAKKQFAILDTKMKTVFSNNIRNNAGFLNRADESGVGARDKLFRQNGRSVFKEVCPMVADQILAQLSEQAIVVDEIRRLWLHQANLSMNQLISRRVLGREAKPEEAPVILDEYANTSSAGSVIAFHNYSNDLQPGDKGVICSFGAGYSVGSVIVECIS